VDFRREGCVYKGVVLTGKIDRLEIDSRNKTVRIIDFKSGTPSAKWASASKYLNYKQQLYFYVLLIETSRTYQGYAVESAALEFIEPLTGGESAPPLELRFDQAEYERFKQLVITVWDHIQSLNLPDVSAYPTTPAGIKQFEADLLNGTI
jgi:RecB family exonuclease